MSSTTVSTAIFILLILIFATSSALLNGVGTNTASIWTLMAFNIFMFGVGIASAFIVNWLWNLFAVLAEILKWKLATFQWKFWSNKFLIESAIFSLLLGILLFVFNLSQQLFIQTSVWFGIGQLAILALILIPRLFTFPEVDKGENNDESES